MLVHGQNLTQKENHATKYRDDKSKQYLAEIRAKYDAWHEANLDLIGPGISEDAQDADVLSKRVELFSDYKDFIDQQNYAENFDSRSNLHSTVLEEFIFYLFKDLVREFSKDALIGKAHTFKDIFFQPHSYKDMLCTPNALIETKDHDFVIGASVLISFSCKNQESSEQHQLEIPAVAIECKTYLDKTMLEGSSMAAEQLKYRNPNAVYIVVSEWLKLTQRVNLRKFKVDQIYVLRKQKKHRPRVSL